MNDAPWKLVSFYRPNAWGGTSSYLVSRSGNPLFLIWRVVSTPLSFLGRWLEDLREIGARKPFERSTEFSDPIVKILEPVVLPYGITPATEYQYGTAVVWCSAEGQLNFTEQFRNEHDLGADPTMCADLWIYLNPRDKELCVHFFDDLYEAVTGDYERNDGGYTELCEDFEESIALIAPMLEEFLGERLGK